MAEPSSNRPSLTILGGPLAGQQLVVEEDVDNILIGSDPTCRFHLPLPGVSPIHARLWVDLEGITVYDTNSPRGLYINDDRVTAQAAIHNGDILWLGAPGDADVVMIQCRVPEPHEAAATPEAAAGEPDLTVALDAPPEPAAPPVEATTVLEVAEEAPSPFEVVTDEGPFVAPPVPPPAPPRSQAPPPEAFDVPAFFEDDTIADRPAPAAPPPPASLPPVPLVAEEEEQTVAMAAPPAPAPEPTVAMPAPPPPAPEPRATPPPAPAAKPAPSARTERPASASGVSAPRPRPAGAPPRPAGRVAAPPVARPARARSSSPTGLYAALGLLAVALLAGGGYFAWQRLQSSAPPTTVAVATQPPAPPTLPPETLVSEIPEPTLEPEPTPEPTLEPTPIPSPQAADATAARTPPPPPTTIPVKATPTPARAAPPTTLRPELPSPEVLKAQQVATLLSQADDAVRARNYEAAASLYDQALKLDPQNAAAGSRRQAALAGAAAARKTFATGRTIVTSSRAAKKGVSGFESEDVAVAQADYSGRIEFEASPRSVKPGDSYGVKVYLLNDGKKDLKIAGLTVATVANGNRSGGAANPAAREVDRQQRVLLHETSGVWAEGVNSWSMEVVVTLDRGDTFKSTLAWR